MWRIVKGLPAVAGLCMLLSGAAGAQVVKRLILTDGSYQTASEVQRQGERVRYLSAERGEWEELPASLVDWKATEEWNAESAKRTAEADSGQALRQVTAEEIAARKEEMLNTPTVAAGMKLPAEGGIFLFEDLAGHPALVKLDGARIQVDEHTGTTILKRSVIPLASQKQTIELPGSSAKVRMHTATPTVFVDMENDGGLIPAENFRLVRVERKRDKRVLGTNTLRASGNEEMRQQFVRSRAEKFSGDWWKIVPLEDLAPGEYALVLYNDSAIQGNVVWDFAVEK